MERTAQAIAEANRIDISKIGAITGSSALAALDFSKFSNDIEQIRAIHTSYSGQLASALRDLLNAQEISEETVRPIQALINLKVDSLPQGRISAEGLMTLLLTLISVLIAYGSYGIAIDQSTSSEETAIAQARQSSQITDLLRRLVEDTQRLIPDQDQSTYYVVEREVILRLKPTSKSAPFGSLFPNQKVRGVQRSHKWIYVEYFDEIEGVPRYGWAYKKYFQHISRDNLNNVFSPRQSPDELSESLTIEERLAITDNWEQTNAKRVELIHKQIKNIITAGETRELDHLQRLADQRIRLLAPLPIDPLKTVLDNVTRRN